jgi:hypothetical protein
MPRLLTAVAYKVLSDLLPHLMPWPVPHNSTALSCPPAVLDCCTRPAACRNTAAAAAARSRRHLCDSLMSSQAWSPHLIRTARKAVRTLASATG